MAQTRAKTVKQEREEVYAALEHAASFSLFGRGKIVKSSSRSRKKGPFVEKKGAEARHRTEWYT